MSRDYDAGRYDRDDKQRIRVVLRGEGELDRHFRSKGEAIEYLMREGYSRQQINQLAKFINS